MGSEHASAPKAADVSRQPSTLGAAPTTSSERAETPDAPRTGAWSLRNIAVASPGRAGSALPSTLRPWLSRKTGANVDGVRVHTDGAAGALAAQHEANALTHGQHIYFGAGQYRPG